ncbi:MAG TPA: ArgE/DapE family deacylase [Clostridia bacterium]|nr:ArgE/DapE family deacylase [Clostridia bacterium]
MNTERFISEIRLDSAKDMLKDMIAIPSVTGNEGKLAEYIEKKLIGFGLDKVRKQQVEEGRYNVIAELNGVLPGKTTLLTGHMDTVAPGAGWETDPFEAVEKDGRIYGRGANDMKAGISVILELARIISKNRNDFSGKILIALVCDEEAYSAGVIELLKEGIKADFGLSAEPEYNAMLIGAVGKILIKADIEGKSAHAAQPQCGTNAIEDAGRFLAGMESLGSFAHERMGRHPYVTLKISGGPEGYCMVVPEHCTILINKHTVPGESREAVLESMEKLVRNKNLKSKFRFSVERPFYPPYEVSEEHKSVKLLCEIYQKVTGRELPVAYGDGVCDNNYLVPEAGIPTVCLGPSGANMHSGNEWVEVKQIEDILKIYMHFLIMQD